MNDVITHRQVVPVSIMRGWGLVVLILVFNSALVIFSGSGLAQTTETLVARFAGPVTAVVPLDWQGQLLVAAQNGVVVLDADGRVLKQTALEMQQVTDAKFGRDRKSIWFAGGDPAETGKLVEIELQDLTLRQSRQGGHDVFTSLDLTKDGRTLVSSSIDGLVYCFSLQQRRELRQDASKSAILKGHSKAVSSLVLIDDSQLVSVAEDMSVRLWDLKTESMKRTMNQHVGAVLGVRLLEGADSSRPVVASWGKDRTVRFWQPTIGRMMRFVTIEGVPLSTCWDEASEKLWVGDSEGSIHRIDWKTGELESSTIICKDWISCLAVNPATRSLYAGTSSGDVWRLEQEKPVIDEP